MTEKLKTAGLGADTNTMTTPFSLYDAVAEMLRLEISLCEQLHEVVERKLEAIVQVNADIITETAQQEECLASQLSDMTARRTTATTDLCYHLQAPAISRLGELLEFMNVEGREEIEPLREKLIVIGTKVRNTNDMNRKILEGSQQRIGDYFKQASQVADGAKTYTAKGENTNRNVSFFNAEA